MQLIQSSIIFIKNKRSIIYFVIIFIFTLAALLLIEKYYKITEIEVKNNTKGIQIAGIPVFKNKSIIFTSEENISNAIVQSNAIIKNVQVTKVFPNKVILRLELYNPVVYLKAYEGYYLLSEEGVILSKYASQENKRIPIILYYQNFPFADHQAGTKLGAKDIEDSIFFLQLLKSFKISIISIDIAGFHMLGLYSDNKKYIFTAEKDRKIQQYNLEQAIERFKIDGKDYKSIDVRFDKPVIGL